MAQRGLTVEYDYDAAGNRTLRKTLNIKLLAPPAPTDSTSTEQLESEGLTYLQSITPLTSDTTTELYYVETISQTEIKIYPNPTAEKVTLEIVGWENLQMGVFKLYSLNGQLLQEQPVYSLTTTISLANLPKGTYILNVHINNHIEDWKIIKN
jgi:hypothetical protein